MGADSKHDIAYEKRQWPRYPYGVIQRIGQVIDGRLPRRDALERVRCADLSRGGLLFYRSLPLAGDKIVVGFGEPGDEIYFLARVAHCSEVKQWGLPCYRIGCKLTARVQPCGDAFIVKGDIESAFMMVAQAPAGS